MTKTASEKEKKSTGKVVAFTILGLVVLGCIGYFSYIYFQKMQVAAINAITAKQEIGFSDCREIEEYEVVENPYFNETSFKQAKTSCRDNFALKNLKENPKNYCRVLLTKNDTYIKNNYLDTRELQSEIENCRKRFFNPELKLGRSFDIRDDFKTTIELQHSFFSEYKVESDDFEKDTQKLAKLISETYSISPEAEIRAEDIELKNEIAELKLALAPNTEYRIAYRSKKRKDFRFTTPEKKYFGFIDTFPLTLYTPSHLPKFELYNFNSGKTQTELEICEIALNEYAALEVYKNTKLKKLRDDFYKNKLQDLKTIACFKKTLTLAETKDVLDKKSFDFDEFLAGKTGLFMLRFTDSDDVFFNGEPQRPHFFGLANSHILAKVSATGEGFFFVNDMQGNPLANQEIRISLNSYHEHERVGRNETITEKDFQSPLDTAVFSDSIVLGTTGKDGILKVQLTDFIDEPFIKTLGWDEWETVGGYDMFFVESIGELHRSYLSSTWNGGIEPWNFGYTIGYNRDGKALHNSFYLSEYQYKPRFNGHLFTDRMLYLPDEKVHIKAVVRSDLLEVPTRDFELILEDSNGEELVRETLRPNEYGSIVYDFELSEDAALGYYNARLETKNGEYDERVATTHFSVEVFQKPKFENTVTLTTNGLRADNSVKITNQQQDEDYYYRTEYEGQFEIQGTVSSKYYSGAPITNTDFSYKIYRQRYYDNSYWDNCYYGCYWEPEKEFYSEGEGTIGADGVGKFSQKVDFVSNYNDYKYIVEVTISDESGETVTGANSIIAKLPNDFKRYNDMLSLELTPSSRFVEVGAPLTLTGKLSMGEWTADYNDSYALIIKRKNYHNKVVTDVNGFERNLQKTEEVLEKVVLLNDKNAKVKDGQLHYTFTPEYNGEYIFEYGKLDSYEFKNYFGIESDEPMDDKKIKELVAKLNTEKKLNYDYSVYKKECREYSYDKEITQKDKCVKYVQVLHKDTLRVSDIFSSSPEYFPVIAYSEDPASNPIKDDNKLTVLSEKISYKIGETAKVFVRLPKENAKVLLTIEKNGVEKSEYFDVKGNVFFKEILVDESFVPNAYVSVFMVDTSESPEYKVGYTEIVVDKADKKAYLTLETDTKTYSPRDTVTLDIAVQDQDKNPVASELTVLVVDDALISLMGNINPNTLEFIYKKLPFSIQTAMSNIAMVRNYYFSRRGLVGGSGAANFKGGDSAISSRSIFKNTAFYDASVVTDANGEATVTFELPDNLTNFRVMALSNSKDNHFGYSESFIEVRKAVTLEEHIPLMLRNGDSIKLGATLFNASGATESFDVTLKIEEFPDFVQTKTVELKNDESTLVYFDFRLDDTDLSKLNYSIRAEAEAKNIGDQLEKQLAIHRAPVFMQTVLEQLDTVTKSSASVPIENNTLYEESYIEIAVSGIKIAGIGDIYRSLIVYPYGCIEQLTSSTLPNVIAKNISNYFPNDFNAEKVDKNIAAGVEKILKHQTDEGGFLYWPGSDEADLTITPYVLRSLMYMRDSGVAVPDDVINNGLAYLETNYKKASGVTKAEIYETLARYSKAPELDFDFSKMQRHELIAVTSGLLYDKETHKALIEENIQKIASLLDEQASNYYWSRLGDKALFAQLLIDYDFEGKRATIEELIETLYEENWESYYYSTKTKNSAFMAFYSYLQKVQTSGTKNAVISLGDVQKKLTVSETIPVSYVQIPLLDVVENGAKSLDLQLSSDSELYAQAKLQLYPKDIQKIKSYENDIAFTEKIYEITDSPLLSRCEDNWYFTETDDKDCESARKEHTGNSFEKGKLYQKEIKIIRKDKDSSVFNLTLEDYLPAGITVINSNFKTNSSDLKQQKSWNWNHIEMRPNVFMANASYFNEYNTDISYVFRAAYSGEFIDPPTSVYLMYEPEVRAYGNYKTITISE